jgi:hypothetical protein
MGDPESSRRPWRIVADATTFEACRHDPAFHRLVKVAHIVNSLRFAEGAAFDRLNDETPAATRQRAGSYFYLAGILDEGLNFAERLGQDFRTFKTYEEGFRELLKDPEVRALRSGLLDRLRNQAVFHNDDIVTSSTIPELQLNRYVFAAGETQRMGDVYYALADIAVMSFAIGHELPNENFNAALERALRSVVELSKRFAVATDQLIGEVLNTYGWVLERD